jgi:hypothetical protein
MNIESSKFIVEVAEYREVNNYLQLGWVLINQYVIDVGEPGQPSQRPRFILAWQNHDDEPQHPQDSTYLSNQRDAAKWRSKSI